MVIKLPEGVKFRDFTKTHGDKTQVEMVSVGRRDEQFLLGIATLARTISPALKKIGLCSKKRPMATVKERITNGEHSSRSCQLCTHLKLCTLMSLAWIIALEYDYSWNQKRERFHSLKSGRRQGRVNMIAQKVQPKTDSSFYG
jgi:hypothetical protein